jgi:uridine kinase
MNPFVIGVAGGTGSGKTTVINRIKEQYGGDIAILDHDSYYKDLAHLSPEERAEFNFDHPNSLESELMVKHLDALIAGKAVEKPMYNFSSHSRKTDTENIAPKAVIVVEGILIFTEPELLKRMNLKLFVDTDSDIRLIRRIRRDTLERGRSLDAILKQYEKHVRQMHLEFVEPSKRVADVIIPRGGHNDAAMEMVFSHIDNCLS